MPSESNTIDDFGKSITNDFNITVANLVVNEDALVKGDLTVLGAFNFDTLNIDNLNVDNATIKDLTLENPLPTSSGGTGLATIGTAGQVLAVNSTGTGLVYTSNTEGSVTSVSALPPLSSSGGTTPTISIPLTTGTGSTVVLKTAPDLIGPVTVEGDINAENGSVGLVARYDLTEPSASISMNTFSNKNSRIRTSNDVEFRIDNIGLGQRKKMKLMADSVTITRQEGAELNDGFYVDLPTTIRNDSFIRETYCSEMLNFPQGTSIANENGIRMYSGTNKDNPRFELGITSGDFYPATSSSYFKIADVSGVFSVTLGTGSVNYNLGTGNFSVTTAGLGNVNFLCAGSGAVSAQTVGTGAITLSCVGVGGIFLTTSAGLITLSCGGAVTFTSGVSITLTAPTTIFTGFAVFNGGINVNGLIAGQGGMSISGGTTLQGATNITGATSITGALNISGALGAQGGANITGGLTLQGGANVTGGLTLQGGSNITGAVAIQGATTVTGAASVSGFLSAQGGGNVAGGLSVQGGMTLTGAVLMQGAVTITGALAAQGGANITGGLTLQGGANITGAVAIQGATTVTGATSVSGFLSAQGGANVAGGLSVQGGMTLTGAVLQQGAVTITGALAAQGGVNISGGLTVQGGANVTGAVAIQGATNITGILTAQGGANVTGGLSVQGGGNITGGLALQGGANITGAVAVQGATNITGTLTVQGGANISGAVAVQGPTNLAGSFTATGGAAITGLTFINGATQITGALNVSGSFTTQGVATFLSSTFMINGIGVTGGTTINTVGQRCDITGGKITLKSELDAVNIIAPEGGFNIGSSFAGGVVGAVRIETQNGFTQFATGNIDIRTTTKFPYVGNGNVSINTLNAYSGDIFIYSKARVSIAAANASPGQSGADPQAVSFDTSIVTSGGYNFKFPATIGTLNSIFLSGGSSEPLSWLAPGAANTFLKSDGTTLSWSSSSSFTDWANPGAIGSITPNTGQFTTLAAISSNSSFTSSLFTATNNTITSGITGAFLAPNLDLDQSTGIGIGKSLSNNNFTFLLFGNNTVPTTIWSIYNSSSFISQQLNGPIDMSGSKITLQTHGGAEAKIVVENNNTVNVSGTTTVTSSLSSYADSVFKVINTNTEPLFTASVLAPNMALNTPIFLAIGKSLSGSNAAIFGFGNNATPSTVWSMYNSTTQITQEFNGQITLTAPRTQITNLLDVYGNTLISSNLSSYTDSIFSVQNLNADPKSSVSILGPSMTTNSTISLDVGKSLSVNNCMQLQFQSNDSDSIAALTMFASSTSIKQTHNGPITLQAPSTVVTGSLRVNGNVDGSSAGDGVCMGLQTDGYAAMTLNGTQGKGGYIDFSTNGVDFYGRIMGNPSPNRLEYSASQHIFTNETGGSSTVSIIGNTSMTGTLQVNNQTTITASFSTYADAPLKVINTNENPIFTASFLAPNIAFDNFVFMGFGKSLTPANAGIFNFRAAATPTTAWTMYGSSSMITQEHNGRVLITATSTDITGPLQVTNGNIFTNQNIIGGITTINNGDLALTAASPGTILIRGGTGSIITLPDATTLIVGYSYTINNNSNHTATINQFTSGSVGIVAPNNMATVTCISTSSANGQWDLHVSGLNPNTDWANPGAIGSITPNTGQFTTLEAISTIKANSTNLSNQSTLNPAITVFSFDGGFQYGMDLGFNPSTSRYRTRIFSPADIALSIRPQNATSQADFIDYLIVNGSNGTISLQVPTTITSNSTSYSSGVLNITNTTTNSANVASFMTPDIPSDGITVLSLGKSNNINEAVEIIYGHNTSLNSRYTTWGFYGGGGSKITLKQTDIFLDSPGNISLISKTTVTSSLSSYADSVFKVINTNTEPLFTASVLAPNTALNNPIYLAIGKSLSGSNAAIFGFGNTATPSTVWSMYNSATAITQEFNGQITLTAPRTQITNLLDVYGNTLISSNLSSATSAIFEVVNTNTAPIFSSSVLAPNVASGNIVGFAVGKSLSTSNASLFIHRNITIPASVWGMYNSTTEIEQEFNGAITLRAPSTVATGSLRVSGNVDGTSQGDGVCMGLQNDGYASITLNATQGQSGYIDFSTNGVDFYTRIMGKPSLDMDYYANAHNFKTQDGGNNVALLPNFLAPGQTLILDTNRHIRSRIGGSNTVYNAAQNTSVGNAGWTSINNLLNVRTKGFGRLIWVNQATGFRNETGQAVLVSVTFSCQRVSNGFGVTALRIVAAGFVLGVQDVAALDAVSISGQAYLENNETIDCQIYQNSGVTVEYHNVYVNLNTFPLP